MERSTREPGSNVTVEVHAEDYHRVVEAVGLGSVDAFGSSGGGMCGLHWVVAHPEDVHTFVSHEPPVITLLEDSQMATKVNADIVATYQRDGFGPAMAKFIQLVMHPGLLPDDYLDRPAPDPAQFGLPIEGDGSRHDLLLSGNLAMPLFEPEVEARSPRSSARCSPRTNQRCRGQNHFGRHVRSALSSCPVGPVRNIARVPAFPGSKGLVIGDGGTLCWDTFTGTPQGRGPTAMDGGKSDSVGDAMAKGIEGRGTAFEDSSPNSFPKLERKPTGGGAETFFVTEEAIQSSDRMHIDGSFYLRQRPRQGLCRNETSICTGTYSIEVTAQLGRPQRRLPA